MKKKKNPYTDKQREVLKEWADDVEFRTTKLNEQQRLLLDFHVTSSKVMYSYSKSSREFLNDIRDKWVLYKQNDDKKDK